MGKVMLDEQIRSKLNGLQETLEICDETGQILGLFVPAAQYRTMFYTTLAAESPHSPEELTRRRQETHDRSLAEIWQRLGRV